MNAATVMRVSLGALALASSRVASSQLEEIVVTGSRVQSTPGVFLRRHADYLLLEVVTSTLGAEYRVVVGGIDRPVEWFRLGLLDLGLFIPYRYAVIPQSITSVATDEC